MANKKPLYLCTLYLDSSGGPGEQDLSSKSITISDTSYTARVINYGQITQSCPYPAGLIEIGGATVTLADTDGSVRAWLNQKTPIRRFAKISFYDENNPATPIPLYYGQFVPGGITGGPGTVTLKLQDTTKSWFSQKIPKLVIRDNFPNLPYDIQSAFAPIIFGTHDSYSADNWKPQGRIAAILVDTTVNWYLCARHKLKTIDAVYRRNPAAAEFTLVDSSEYEYYESEIVATDGLTYYFSGIAFTDPQLDGTLINVDVQGYPYYWDLSTSSQVDTYSRNPVDHIINLIGLLLMNQVTPDSYTNFDTTSFNNLRAYFVTSSDISDYAITGDVNSTAEITWGLALSRLLDSFLIDLTQNGLGKLAVSTFDPVDYLNPDNFVLATVDNILRNSFKPDFADSDKMFNQWRYLYQRQNAGLTSYIHSALEGQWGWEALLDNITDQDELGSATGTNPILQDVVKLWAVGDDQTAYDMATARIGFNTLRSYLAEFDLPFPEYVAGGNLFVGNGILITHYQGIGDGGWTNVTAKIIGLKFDLSKATVHVKCVLWVDVSTEDWSITVNPAVGVHPDHAVQVPYPLTPVTINGLTTGVYPDTVQNFNGTSTSPSVPPPPAVGVITSGQLAGFGFGNGSSYYTNSTGAGAGPGSVLNAATILTYLQVIFQRSAAADGQINISAYVPNLAPLASGASGPRIYVGVLTGSPPSGQITIGTAGAYLGTADKYRAIFYSTDFDRYYWWTGVGWSAIAWDGGNIILRTSAPAGAYHLCDGSTVNMSTQSGGVASTALPNLTSNTPIVALGGSYTASGESLIVTSDELPACMEVPEYNPNAYVVQLMPYIRL